MKVLSVVGNRPQFIKSGPVSAALREAGIEEVGLHTGQHWDRELSDVFYEELGLPEPRYRLDLHTADAEAMRPAIAAVLGEDPSGWTFVFPLPPPTRHALDEHGFDLGPTLQPVAPLGYLEMLAPAAGALRVVTDSGGLQKEAYWLGIPCITLRPSTEWVDTVRL